MRAEEEGVQKRTRGEVYAATETNEQLFAWGIGKHACPSRFFAVDLIKTIQVHIWWTTRLSSWEKDPEYMD